MTYELAEQLKDAGFPQSSFTPTSCRCMDNTIEKDGTWVCGCKDEDYLKVPTLSELIAACGEEFILEKVNSGGLHSWTAGTFIDRNGEIEYAQTAETPEEAVAKLWLALNKKSLSQE
jgi:hypothetical protein